jgi:hypothetical protein
MPVRTTIAAFALSALAAFAQSQPEKGVEIQMILTVADHMSHKPIALKPGDISIIDATVTSVEPITPGHDLELYLLVDDAANFDFGGKLANLKQFITSQPATVPIGIAYIHDGALSVAQTPTTDHAKVAHVLRAPEGSKSANPYCALSDLMLQWQKNSLRREIVMVSTGIDETAKGGICANAETTIHDAQHDGIEIFALYNPAGNYTSDDWFRVDEGVTDLAHVCYETGGESYFQGHSPVGSLEPYLDDIAEHLAHQYLVKFRLVPGSESGFRTIYVSSGPSAPEVMVPESVWVPAPGK